MPHARFLKLPAEKRERILHVAARRFGEEGFRQTSLNRILEECGVSKGAAYYYFDGKADLFGATVEHVFADLLEEVGLTLGEVDRRTFWPRLKAVQQRWLERIAAEPWLGGLAKAIRSLSEQELRHPELAAALERTRWWLTELLARGQQLGTVRQDLPAPLLSDLVASVDQAADRWLAENWDKLQAAQLQAINDALFQSLRRLLQPPRRRA